MVQDRSVLRAQRLGNRSKNPKPGSAKQPLAQRPDPWGRPRRWREQTSTVNAHIPAGRGTCGVCTCASSGQGSPRAGQRAPPRARGQGLWALGGKGQWYGPASIAPLHEQGKQRALQPPRRKQWCLQVLCPASSRLPLPLPQPPVLLVQHRCPARPTGNTDGVRGRAKKMPLSS